MIFSLIGSLLGFGTSIIPQVLDFFRKSKDQEHELKLMDKQMEMQTVISKNKVDEINVKADIEEIKQLYKHDSSLKTDSSFINMLRASIRPVITYFFFGLFLVIKGVTFYAFIRGDLGVTDWHGIDYTSIYEALGHIWDKETQALFSSVIGFHFGSRTVEKFRKRY